MAGRMVEILGLGLFKPSGVVVVAQTITRHLAAILAFAALTAAAGLVAVQQ